MKNLININQNLFLKNLSIKNINQNYLNWFQDQEIKRNIINTNFFKLSDLKKYFLKEKKKKNTIFFGIFYKKKHIGNLKYEGIYKNSRKASFGILIGNKNYRGKEIGYKVINKSINFLIEKYRIKKFIISCKKNNYKALNLYKKLGFRIIKNLNNQVFLELDVFLSKVVIGTANFKNIYGIRKKIVKKNDIKNILNYARKINIKYIDTASNYGLSEKVLGNTIKNDFEIISKFSKIDFKLPSVKEQIESNLKKSLFRLKKKSLYGYLVHEANDLISSNGKKIVEALIHLKKRGKIKKIGVSIYTTTELNKILKIFKPDIIQVPINILNQQFIKKNYLRKIKKLGIEIHARSLFFQGLLLKDNYKFLPTKNKLRKKIEHLNYVCKKKSLPKLMLLIKFVAQISEINKIVLGIDSANQLKKIINANNSPELAVNFSRYSVKEKEILDPRLW